MIACSINVQDPPTASVPIGKGFNGLSSREKNLRLTWNTSFNIIKICNANKFNERTDLGWKLICGYLRWHASLTYEILPRLVCRSEEGSRCLEALSNLFLGKKAIFSGENLSQWRTIESHTRGETITVVLVTLDFCAWKLIRALPSSAQAFWMVLSHDLSIHKRKYNVTFNKNLLSYHIVRLFSNRWQTSICDRKISDTLCCA